MVIPTLRALALTSTRLAPRAGLISIRPSSCRSIVFPLATRGYATPAQPKKGSVGAEAKQPRASKTTKTTATKKSARKPKKTGAATKKTSSKKPAGAKKISPEVRKEKARALREARTAKKEKAREKKKALAEKQKEKKKAARQRQRENAKNKALAQKFKDLKAKALEPPRGQGMSTAWVIYWKSRVANDSSAVKARGLTAAVKDAVVDYRALSDSQRESYARAAREDHVQAVREYKEWVEQHTPLQIRNANRARAHLRRVMKRNFPAIKDDRQLKKPSTPFIRFATEYKAQHRDQPITESSIRAGEQWRNISEGAKKRFYDEYQAAHAQYVADYKALYGELPQTNKKTAKSAE